MTEAGRKSPDPIGGFWPPAAGQGAPVVLVKFDANSWSGRM